MNTAHRPADATPTSTVTRFNAPGVRSLVWDGDTLVDWVDGGARWTLEGEHSDPLVRYAFSFDMATSLPGSPYSVIYKRLGTKGLVLNGGRVVRELNRSFYQAEVYEYPIALLRLPSGRPAVAHCPDDYNRLRIDDLETGEVIASASDEAADFFHSRLAVSPDGRWLASAGWIWHPVDDVGLYDLAAALTDGTALDKSRAGLDVLTETGNAAGFDSKSRLLVTADRSGWADDDAPLTDAHGGSCLVRIAPGQPGATERWPLAFDAPFMAVGADHLLLFAGTPSLVSIETGQEVATWPDIPVRIPSSSIQRGAGEFTSIACDLARSRVAIAHGDQISIIAFELATSAPI
jgi:hypothetical protein